MSLETLAKVDLHCCFDGAIDPSLLATWQARAGGEATGGSELAAQLHVSALDQLPDRKAWLKAVLRSPDDLTEAALVLARRLIAEVVVHVELVVDADTLACGTLQPIEVVQAIDAGCEAAVTERDDVFLSWVLLVELPATADSNACVDLVRGLVVDRPPRLAGIVVADDPKAGPLSRVAAAVELARRNDLKVVVVAGDRKDAARVHAALEFGAQRIVGGTAALSREETLVRLRAGRVPVVSLPTVQMMAGMARSWNSHPLKRFKEASVLTAVGSGWPTWTGSSLSGELEAVSRNLHWRLDDLRNATTRAVEAGFMAPTLRFQLARTVEIWRHRPLVQAQAKAGGDPFAM
ncbi:MAG: hypothetical protein FJ100_11715 [Deltaproteobacteria bacterium]|nr:hypothetical protein [Deltaproteobacteria bacterium]